MKSLATALLLLPSLVFAANTPLPQNPDDYDVPKYRNLYRQAEQRLRNSESLLASLNKTLRQTDRELRQEETRLQRIRQEIRNLKQAIQTDVNHQEGLRANLKAARQERRSINQRLPRVQERYNQTLNERNALQAKVNKLKGRVANLKNQARQKETQANALKSNADKLLRELRQHQKEQKRLQDLVTQTQTQLKNTTARLNQRKRQLVRTRKQLASAKAGMQKLAQDEAAKKQTYTDLDAKAVRLEEKAKKAKKESNPNYRRILRRAKMARRQANKAKRDWQQARNTLKAARQQVAKLQTQVTNLQNQVTQMQRQVANMNASLKGYQADLQGARAKASRAATDHRNARTLAAAALKEAAEFRNRANRAATRLSQRTSDLREANTRLGRIDQKLRRMETKRTQLATEIQNTRQEIRRLETQIVNAERSIDRKRNRAKNIRRKVDKLRVDYAEADRNRERAVRMVREDRLEADNLAKQLNRVERNYRRGIEVATRDGEIDGREDGYPQGQTQGREKGRADGEAVGNRVGMEKGKAKGIADARARGRSAGSEKGRIDGEPEGRKLGQTEGDTVGQREGNKDGYDSGYAKTVSRFRSKTLEERTVSNTDEVLSAAFSQATPKMNLRRNYPHPALDQAYNDSYRAAFNRALNEGFNSTYENAKKVAYDKAYSDAYDDYASRSYENEENTAYDRAYRASKARAKEAARRAAYDVAYKARYTTAFNEGLETGSSEATNYYTNNAILEIDGAVLVDANQDGIVAPGEQVFVTVSVKNYGMQDSPRNLVAQLFGSNGLFENSDLELGLKPVSAQSRTSITNVGPLRIAKSEELFSRKNTVDVTILQNRASLGSVKLGVAVQYPYVIPTVNTPDYVLPSQENVIEVLVKNRGTKASLDDVTIKLTSTDKKSEIMTAAALLGRIPGSRTGKGSLSFSFPEKYSNQSLEFLIEVFEGDWLLGKRKLKLNSAKRWSFNPSGRGLIVISSNKEAQFVERKLKKIRMRYDIWDIRVEGQLTKDAVEKYAAKRIFFPSVTSDFTKATQNAVAFYLRNQDGRVYAGMGDGANRTVLGLYLMKYTAPYRAQAFGKGLNIHYGNVFGDAKGLVGLGPDVGFEQTKLLTTKLIHFDLFTRSLETKARALINATKKKNSFWKVAARAAILAELWRELQDDRRRKGNAFVKRPHTLQYSKFVNLALSKTGEGRRTLLMLYPDLKTHTPKKWTGSKKRSKALKNILKPMARAYKKEIGK